MYFLISTGNEEMASTGEKQWNRCKILNYSRIKYENIKEFDAFFNLHEFFLSMIVECVHPTLTA